jgi:putative spermidine/putrescine transport system permease protein
MTLSRRARWLLGGAMAIGLAFIYVPMLVLAINSFNSSRVFAWPPKSFTTRWWGDVFRNTGVRSAVLTSVEVGLIATAFALVLGTLLAFALSRYSFFGRQAISVLVILPIALPGIVTALAFRTAFLTILGIQLSIWTVAISHATFCMVVMYNNVVARLRRMGSSSEEASMDLGADTFVTFRLITLPLLRGAMFAGALLAFGLSFDEIVVTLFTAPPGVTTLPIWIFQNLSRPNQGAVVNVVAVILVLSSIIPVYVSQKIGGDSVDAGGRI